jgi:hypothetical protein
MQKALNIIKGMNYGIGSYEKRTIATICYVILNKAQNMKNSQSKKLSIFPIFLLL